MTIRAGVVGAAGFAGIEAVRLILGHPDMNLTIATSDSLAGTPVAKAYPAFTGATDIVFTAHESSDFSACDIVFLAVPHTAALSMAPDLISKGVSVIDLSADFRLKDPKIYEAWYGTKHTATELLASAAFGLPEITRDELLGTAKRYAAGEAVLVGCAGCYPTATSLAAAPALRAGVDDGSSVVVVDAISGVTGAGKKATERTHFCFANENLEAYGVGNHRHMPEIEQILDIPGRLIFTPHLAPLNRGLLSTVTIPLDTEMPLPSTADMLEVYRSFYEESPLVSVLPEGVYPRTASVAGTARAHVGLRVVESTRCLVAMAAIDNLGKGAAAQAVQCANILCGLPEQSGLMAVSVPV